ncbi:MAG TPA: DUF1223 domain-containing protein [Burkholderiales bacterium]|nr:DUF1223 domain-containing protein [Burkholderiales bacterium]
MIHRLAAVFAAACAVSVVQAAPEVCTAKSGAATGALVELYTSEGCDSCPPADRWLSGLPAAGFGAGSVVPLALHVDYWDYIGWKDPFAKTLFSARQREIAAVGRNRVVYTPQVVLAGKDFRGWPARSRFAEAVAAINAMPARAGIELAIEAGEIRAQAAVPRREDREDAALFVAVYESGLSNRVTAGENRGATLNHDFVAREWWGPLALDAAGTASLARPASPQALANGGVAAFVQSRRTGEVLQALALPACKG